MKLVFRGIIFFLLAGSFGAFLFILEIFPVSLKIFTPNFFLSQISPQANEAVFYIAPTATSLRNGTAAVTEDGEVSLQQIGDFNGDGKVKIADLSILLSHWKGSAPQYDVKQDGRIDILDASVLLSNWTR